MKKLYVFKQILLLTALLSAGLSMSSQVLWSSAAGSAYLTTTNWTGSAVPTSAQIAQFGVNPTPGTSVGMNVNNAATQQVGAVEVTSARLIALTIGHSGSSKNSFYQMNGTTVNAIANVIIRNNSGSTLTFADLAGGSASTLGIVLGNATDNIVNIDGAGGVTISSIISGANKLTKGGSGAGIFQLTGANTYTGTTTVNGGTLQLNRTGGTTIPTTNNVVVNSGGTLRISKDQTLNNLTIASGGNLIVDSGVTLTINGTYSVSQSNSGGGAGTIAMGASSILKINQGGWPGNTNAFTYNASATLEFANSSGSYGVGGTDTWWPSTSGPANVNVSGAGGMTLNVSRTIPSGGLMQTSSTTTITGGITLTMNGTFQINQGGWGGNTGTYSYGATTGTLVFNNSSGSYGVNSGDTWWPTTNGPYNVTVQNGGGITMNVARTVPTTGTTGTFLVVSGTVAGGSALTLNGTTQINGGNFSTTPTYGSSSTLIYNTGGAYTTSAEWTAGATTSVAAGSGIPANVTISLASTNVTLNGGRGVPGNVTVSASTTLTLNATAGDLYLGGNFAMNGSLVNNTRAVFFVLGNAQSISTTGSNVTFDYLLINKTGGTTVTLSNAVIVNNTLTMTAGFISIGTNDLTYAAASGGSSTAYIKTTSTGQVKAVVAGTSVSFPIGNSAYNPLSMSNSGTSDTYGLRVIDGVVSGANDASVTINRTWNISEAVANGSTLSIVATYNSGEENNLTNFTAGTQPVMAFFDGTTNTQVNATLGGTTFTASATLSPGSMTTAQGLRLGKDAAFTATAPTITSFTASSPGSGTSGYVGNTVTITGTNLSSVTSVKQGGSGGTAVSFTLVNSTTVTFTAVDVTGTVYVASLGGNATSGSTYTSLGYITQATGGWSTAGTWLGAAVPPSATTTNITIAHDVTSTSGTTNVGKLTVNGSVTLTITAATTVNVNTASTNSGTITNNGTLTTAATYTNSGTFTIGNGGTFQINQGGFYTGTAAVYNATASTLVFNNSSGQYGVASGHVYWPASSGPVTVSALGAGGVQLQTGTTRSVTNLNLSAGFDVQSAGLLTVTGSLTINTGGGVTGNAPIYGGSSTLIYNTTSNPYGVATEWTGNGTTAGTGIPQNVTIQNTNNVTLPTTDRGLAGNLLVTSGTLTLNATSGDLYVAGNFTQNGTFTANGRAVFFNGSSAQTISGSGSIAFAYLILNNSSGGVAIGSNASVTGASGDVLQLLGATTTSINSGITLTISGAGGNIKTSGGSRTINLNSATSVLLISGGKTVTSASSGALNITSTTANGIVKLSAGVDFGASLSTIGNNTYLQIEGGGFVSTNPPIYAAGSTLVYNSGGTYGASTEWTINANTGVGVPVNVIIGNGTATIVNFGAATVFRQVIANITISTGSTFTLSTAGGGDLYVGGNFTNSGTFTHSTRAVFLNGTGAQALAGTLNGSGTTNFFPFLFISNSTGTVSCAVAINVGTSGVSSFTTPASGIYLQSAGLFTFVTGAIGTVNGTFKTTGTSPTFTGAITFSSTGTYEHAINSGTVPSATWNAGSNCLISGVTTTAPGGLGQAFSDFTWSSAMTASLSLSGGLTNVGRDFVVTNTGSFTLGLTATTAMSLSVGRNFNISGTSFVTMVTGAATTNTTSVSVANNLSITGGGLTIAGTSSTGTGTTTFSVTNSVSNTSSSGTSLVANAGTRTVVFTIGNGYSQNSTGTASLVQGTGAATMTVTSGDFSLVAGTFNMVSASTGAAIINQSNSANAMVISGGTFNTLGTGAGSVTTTNRPIINLSGSFNQSGSSAFEFAAGTVTTAANPTGELRVAKNFTRTSSCTMRNTSINATNNALLLFNGTAQNYDATGLTGNFTFTNVQIGSGSTLTLLSDMTLYGNPQTVTVLSGGKLDCANYLVTSGASLGTTFTASSGSTVVTANQYGLTTSTTGSTGGSVQLNTRTYSSGSSYVFNGSSAQGTGNFLSGTTATANTIQNLTISNSSNVTLDANCTANGTLTMTSGHLLLGSNTLTVGGGITGATAARHVKTTSTGQLKQTIGSPGFTGAILYPVGNSAYNPITLTCSSLLDAIGIRVVDGGVANANDSTLAVQRTWVITEGLAGSTLDVVAQYNAGEEGSAFIAASTPYVGFYKGSAPWVQVAATAAGSGPYTYTTTASISPADMTTGTQYFAIGKDAAFIAPTTNYVWNGGTDSNWGTATNWTPNGVPGPSDNVTISTTGTNTLDITGSVSIVNFTVSGSATFNVTGGTLSIGGSISNTSSANPVLSCSSTINISGSTGQTIPAWDYGNLDVSGGARTLPSSGTVGICGTFTRGGGAYTITGSTVDFKGTGAQTIAAGTYNNLTISQNRGGAAITLASGTIDVASTFSATASNYTSVVTGNTINFSSASAQTIPAFNYGAITNTGNGNRTWATSGTIDVNSTFSPGAGTHTITSSTWKYSSTAASSFTLSSFTTNVAGRQYNNLEIGGGASTNWALTSGFSLGVAGNFIYSGAGTFSVTNGAAATGTMTVDGTFTHSGSGTFNVSNSTTAATVTNLNVTGNSTISSGIMNLVGSSASTTCNGNFTTNDLTISGTGQLVLDAASNTAQGAATVNGNLLVTSTTANAINLGSGTANSSNILNLKGNFTKSGTGTLGFTGTFSSTSGYNFNGTGTQQINFAGANMTAGSFFVATGSVVQLASNITLGSNASASGFSTVGTGVIDFSTFTITAGNTANNTFTLSSTGTFKTGSATGVVGSLPSFTVGNCSFASGGTFEFTGTSVNTGFSTFTGITTASNYTITWTGSTSLTLDKNIALTTLNFTNSGLINLGNFNMTIASAGSITGSSFSSTKMITTDGTGILIRSVSNLNVGIPFTWPIGETSGGAEYSPVTISTIGSNSIAGTIGFKVTDGVQSNMGVATNYLSRYWSITYTGLSSLTTLSSATFTYVSGDVVTGPETSLKANSYDSGNAVWTQFSSSSAGSNVLTLTSGFTLGTFAAGATLMTGNDITGRVDVPVYYQSNVTSGNWTTAASWLVSTDPLFVSPSGSAASSAPTNLNSGAIFILNGHTITANTTMNVDSVVVRSGGKILVTNNSFTIANGIGTDLTVNSGGTIEFASASNNSLITNSGSTVQVNGLMKQSSSASPDVTNGGTITIGATGTYEHARNAGIIPTCSWTSGSTCLLSAVTNNIPSGLAQSFHHFTVNSTLTASVSTSGNLQTINGDFNLTTGASSGFAFSLSAGTSYTLNIAGALTVNNGILDGANSGAGPNIVNVTGTTTMSNSSSQITKKGPAVMTWNFNGNYTQNAGTLEFNAGGSSNTTINFKGDVVMNGPVQRTNGGTHTINFIKASGTQTLSQGSAITNAQAIIWAIGDGTTTTNTVQMLTDVNVGTSGTATFTVNNGSTLDFQDKVLLGSNSAFTMSSTAKLKIGSAYGITTAASTSAAVANPTSGNLQTIVASRSVAATGTFIYSGTVNQVTGNLLPSSISGNLTIANTGTSPTNIVTMSQATTVTGSLNLTSGVFDLNALTFTMSKSSAQSIIGSGSNTFNIIGAAGSLFAMSSAGSSHVLSLSNFGTATSANLTTGANVEVRLNANTQLDCGGNGTSTSMLTVLGTLTMNSGTNSNIANAHPPFYGSGSTLKYNVTYGRFDEWNNTSGPGYPFNVLVSTATTTTLDIANGVLGTARQCAGSLTINDGCSLSMGAMTASLNVLGNVTIGNGASGTLALSSVSGGDIYVGGNWTRNTGSTFTDNTRAVFLNGSANQNIGGAISTTFPYLILNNSAGATLTIGQTVSSTLTLTSGKLTLGNFDLNVTGNISGGTSSNYIVTNGTGRLKQTVGGSAVLFPVGNSAYNPITLTNSGTSDTYGVIEVDAAAGSENNATKIVTRNWDITEAVGGGSNLAVVAQWNAPVAQTGEEASNFVRGNTYKWIGNYTGGSWSHTAATLSGSNPYTYSASGFTSVGKFEIGIEDAFRPIPLVSSYSPTSAYTGDVIHIVGSNLSALTSVTLGGTAATLTTPTATSTDAYYLVTTGTSGSLVVTNASGTTTAATAFTYLGHITDNNTDWNVGATWRGGNVPPASALTTINSNATLTGTVSNNPSTVTINSGKSLTYGASGVMTVNTSVTNNGTLDMTSGGTLTIAASGTLTNNNVVTGGTGTVVFAGAGTLNGSAASTLNNFTINGVATLSTAPTINGTLLINSGNVTASPNYGTSSTLKYNTGGTYGRYVEWNATSGAGYPKHVQVSGSTALNVSNSQPGVNRKIAGNLTVDSGSGFYMDYGGDNMTANVYILGNVINNGNISLSGASGGDIVFEGNWTDNNVSGFNANGRTVQINGTGTSTISGNTTNTFPFLTIGKTSGTVVLANDVTVTNTLFYNVANGAYISTGINTLYVSNNSTSAISRPFVGHVIGNLKRAIATGSNTYVFHLGDATKYTPASLVLNSVSAAGDITASTATPDHANISTSGLDASKSVNRTWTLTNSGVALTNYAATFTFVNSGDLDGGANTANFIAGRYSGAAWSYPTVGTKTSTTTQITSLTGYGDFAIAECKTPTAYAITGGGSYCSGGSGVAVGLASSDNWASYQLQLNGSNTGSPVAGTGSAISFGLQTSAGVYTVIATNVTSGACTATMTGTTGIAIDPTVTPAVTIAATPGSSICTGTSVTFEATPQFGGSTPSYQWKLNGSNVGTNDTLYTNASLANGDIVTCVMTSNASCASPTTATSNAITMTVLAYSTPTVSVTPTPGSSICSGTSTTFTATPTFGGPTPSYQWKLNGSNVGTNSDTYVNASLANSDAITVVLTSDYQCVTTPTATSTAVTMTVTAAPQVDAGTAMTTCGTSAYVFANGASNSNTSSLLWTHNGAGSITANSTTLTPTYTPAAGDIGNVVTFTLTGNGTGPCGSATDQTTLTVTALQLWYLDADSDGYGSPSGGSVAACTNPGGRVTNNLDCCDSNADVNPMTEWWADVDGDGYGSFIIDNGCVTGVGCSSGSWPTQEIPYYPGAHGGASYAFDCNDGNTSVHPGATEICQNGVDDNCNVTVDEGCSGIINDTYANATTVVVNNANAYFPNCQSLSGTLLNADISIQSNPANVGAGGGRDVWYKFVAASTGARIKVIPSGFNAVIELRTAAHPVGQVDVENANSASGGMEILNTNALTIGATYYIAVRNYDNTTGGSFSICVSPLMPSGCASIQPVSGFSLCSVFKSIARGSVANGVTYNFSFTGTGGGASGTTALSGTNGLISLNTTSLGLRYGGIYNVQVDAVYTLQDGTGAYSDPAITIAGSVSSANCTGVTLAAQPNVEVKSTQRCPAVLSRSMYLIGAAVTGNDNICSATSYTFRFTQVTDCTGATTVGLPFTVNSASNTPYLILMAAFPSGTYPLPNLGYWKVEIRPNFSYGTGSYGPAQMIQVNNTSVSMMLPENNQGIESQKSLEENISTGIYPNPNNGEMVNLNISGLKSDAVFVRVLDGIGRVVYSNRYTVSGSLNTVVVFDQPLANGIYTVEFTSDGKVTTERMAVGK